MPTYEFSCKNCGSKFEVLVKSKEKGGIRCPVCQCGDLREVYGANVQNARNSCSSRLFGFG